MRGDGRCGDHRRAACGASPLRFEPAQRPESPFWFNLRQLLLLSFTLVFLGCVFGAVYDSLLNTPDMEVAGSGSSQNLLHWYVDRTAGALPEVWRFAGERCARVLAKVMAQIEAAP